MSLLIFKFHREMVNCIFGPNLKLLVYTGQVLTGTTNKIKMFGKRHCLILLCVSTAMVCGITAQEEDLDGTTGSVQYVQFDCIRPA